MKFKNRVRNRHRLVCGVFVFAVPLWGQASALGRIAGTIQDDRGGLVANAFVTAIGRASAVIGANVFDGSAKTASDGTFDISAVPSGTYQICVRASDSLLLNPCQWSSTPPIATISAGQTLDLGAIELKRGHPLSVELIDDTGDFARNEGKQPGADILIGVWTDSGLFQPARLKAEDSKTRYYEAVVPSDLPIRFSLQSDFYQLSDKDGRNLGSSKGDLLELHIPTGAKPRTIVYHVRGVKH